MPLLCCIQGQGALSERLRSFSMQDLSTIRGDGAPAPSGPPPPGSGRASGKHGQPKMSRSASESAGSSGRCHVTSSLSHFLGLTFTERGPVPQVACNVAFALWTCHQNRHSLDHVKPAKGQSNTQTRPGGWAGTLMGGGLDHLHQRVPLLHLIF